MYQSIYMYVSCFAFGFLDLKIICILHIYIHTIVCCLGSCNILISQSGFLVDMLLVIAYVLLALARWRLSVGGSVRTNGCWALAIMGFCSSLSSPCSCCSSCSFFLFLFVPTCSGQAVCALHHQSFWTKLIDQRSQRAKYVRIFSLSVC